MKSIKILQKYNLPQSVNVKVEKSRHGFYVEFPDFPGLMTQAENQLDLYYMITDALLTYFEVPRKVAKDFSVYYFPPLKASSKKPDTFNKALLFRALTSERSSYEHSSVRN